MATLMKRGGRKPLAIGKIDLSYGSRYDVNDGAYGVQVSVVNAEPCGHRYSLHLTNEEIDEIVRLRDEFAE